jgi:hypothetical protein
MVGRMAYKLELLETLKIHDVFISRCKHSKLDQKNAPAYGNHDFFGQMPMSSSKMLFNSFFMMTFNAKLGTQIQSINIKSSI